MNKIKYYSIHVNLNFEYYNKIMHYFIIQALARRIATIRANKDRKMIFFDLSKGKVLYILC